MLRRKKLEYFYKIATYEGFPFLKWFEEDSHKFDYKNERLYIPYEFSKEDFVKLNEHLINKYPKIIELIKSKYPGFNLDTYKISLLDRKVYKKNSFDEYNDIFTIKGKSLLAFARKILYNDDYFLSIPEANFKDNRKNFIEKVCSQEVFLSKNFKKLIFEIISDQYENNSEEEKFNEINIISYLFNLLSPYSSEFISFLNEDEISSINKNINNYVVISHNSDDIINMSTGRNWTSCTNIIEGAMSDVPYCEAAEGGFIAYLIKEDDLNVENPISRVLIRRFDSALGESIALMEQTSYGQHNKRFLDIVQEWINSKQGEIKTEEYFMMGGVDYSDTYESEVFFGDPEEYLKDISENQGEDGYYFQDKILGLKQIDETDLIQLKEFESSPFFRSKDEFKIFVESSLPTKETAVNVANRLRNERLSKKYKVKSKHLDQIKEFEDIRQQIKNRDLDLLERAVNETFAKEIEEGKAELEKPDLPKGMRIFYLSNVEEKTKLVERFQKNIEIIKKDLEYSEEEKFILESAWNEKRFDLIETKKGFYYDNIADISKDTISSIERRLLELASTNNNLSRDFWLKYKGYLRDSEFKTLIYNNEEKFQKEIIDILKDQLNSYKNAREEIYNKFYTEENKLSISSLVSFIQKIKDSFAVSNPLFKKEIFLFSGNDGRFLDRALRSEKKEVYDLAQLVKKELNSLFELVFKLISIEIDLTLEDLSLNQNMIRALNKSIDLYEIIKQFSLLSNSHLFMTKNNLSKYMDIHKKYQELLEKAEKPNSRYYKENIERNLNFIQEAIKTDMFKISLNEDSPVKPKELIGKIYWNDFQFKDIEHDKDISEKLINQKIFHKYSFYTTDEKGITSIELDELINLIQENILSKEDFRESILNVKNLIYNRVKKIIEYNKEMKMLLKEINKSLKENPGKKDLLYNKRIVEYELVQCETIFNDLKRVLDSIISLYKSTKNARKIFFRNILYKI